MVVDGECLLGTVGVMVAAVSFFLICFGASFLCVCVWLVAVGVWSGWAPPSRREQDGGRCVEQEPGKMCCGSGVSCEWPGVG